MDQGNQSVLELLRSHDLDGHHDHRNQIKGDSGRHLTDGRHAHVYSFVEPMDQGNQSVLELLRSHDLDGHHDQLGKNPNKDSLGQ